MKRNIPAMHPLRLLFIPFLLVFSVTCFGQNITVQGTTITITNHPKGALGTCLTSSQLNTVTSLTISGDIDATDFKTIRDLMPSLNDLNIQGCTIQEYHGTNATWYSWMGGPAVVDFAANSVPPFSFYDKSNLKTILLPESVETIGLYCFYNTQITDFHFPASLKRIENFGFFGCSLLGGNNNIILPDGLTWIGASAFAICPEIRLIQIPSSVQTIKNHCFTHCGKLQTVAFSNLETSQLKTIDENTFVNCKSLLNLELPYSVDSIKAKAFADCSLNTLKINSSKIILTNEAFSYARIQRLILKNYDPTTLKWYSGAIPSNILDSTVLHVPVGCLNNYKNAQNSDCAWGRFKLINEGTMLPAITLSNYSFTAPGEVSFSTFINTIGEVSSLQMGVVYSTTPNPTLSTGNVQHKLDVNSSNARGLFDFSLQNLTASTNYYCKVYLYNPNSTTPEAGAYYGPEFYFKTIGTSLLDGTTGVISGAQPGCVVGQQSFTNAQKAIITRLSINGVLDARDFKSIKSDFPKLSAVALYTTFAAYSGSEGSMAGNYNYPADELPAGAFAGDTLLTNFSLFKPLTSIGESAFYGCKNIPGIVLPDSLQRIRNSAFYGCSMIGSLVIPATVKYIESNAFNQCTKIHGIESHSKSAIDISGSTDVFKGIPTNCVLRVPSGSLSSYANAAQWSNFAEIAEGFVAPAMSSSTGNNYQTSAILYATVTSLGDWLPMQHGFLISKTPQFIYNSSWKVVNLGPLAAPGTFSATLEGLTPNTTYYFRSYVMNPGKTNTYSTAYGATYSFTTRPASTAIYSDGNVIINNATPGCLVGSGLLDSNQKILTEALSIAGAIDARDIKVIRDEMPWIIQLNLSNATIVEYTGTAGPESTSSITYPANTLPSNAFKNKKTISTVDLPSNLKAIDKYAFSQSDISKITLPSGLENLGEESFSYCTKLAIAEIPTTIKSIGNNCFSGDTYLSRINALPATALNLDGSTTVFNNVPLTCILRVPVGSANSYKSTNQWKNFTRIVETFADPVITTSTLSITDTKGTITSATPGCLTISSFLSTTQKSLLTELTISGSIDARDFRIMRDEMPLLSVIDLKNATIASYTGLRGTRETDSTTYLANIVPSYAFHDKSTLTNIILPTTTTILDIYAFYNCSKLTVCTLNGSVNTINPFAFSNCRSLVNFTMPNSLTTLYDQVFVGCTGLKSITFSTALTSLSSKTFSYCSSLESLVIPDNITSIGTYCFNGCSKMTDITLPVALSSLGSQAFMDCNNLKTIYARNPTAPAISSSALDFAPLSQMTLRVPVNSINSYKASTNWLRIPKIVEGYVSPVLKQGASANVKGTTADISSGISLVGDATPTDYGFVYGINPEPIINYSTVYSLGSNTSNASTFSASLNNLTDGATYYVRPYVTVPANSVANGTVYGNQFSFTTSSFKLTLNDTIASIAGCQPGNLCGETFVSQAQKNKITNLTISGYIDARDVKIMRDSMPALRNINLAGVHINAYTGMGGTLSGSPSYFENYLPTNAFIGKISLESIVLPDSVTTLEANAFNGCAKLRSVVLPKYLKTIYGSSFSSCHSLASISLPASITRIDPYSFYGCQSLQTIYAYATTPVDISASDNCFGLVPSGCTLKVPKDALNNYKNAAKWKDFVNIGEGLVPGAVTYNTPTRYTSAARMYAYLTNMGDAAPVNCGFIWGKTQNLTLATATKSSNGIPTLNTTVYTDITGLNPGETIYYRFYLTNPGTTAEAGTLYFPVTSLTTTQNTENINGSNLSILTDVTPGSISDNTYLSDAQKAVVNALYISGTLDARDLKAIRDKMPNLYSLYIRNVKIAAYSGSDGPEGATTINYSANTIPAKSLRGSKISTLELPSGIVAIGDSAFSKLSIYSLSIPSGVSSLGSCCFADMTNLGRIYLPAGLTQIGTDCFANCTTLAYIHCNPVTPVALTGFDAVFKSVKNTTCRVYIPYGTTTSYKNATGWSSFTNLTEMPALPSSTAVLSQNGTVASISGTTPGCLMQNSTITAVQKSTITDLTISGTLDPRDLRIIRDEMPALKNLDLSNATLAAYSGYWGTYIMDSTAYTGNQMYVNALNGMLNLEKVVLPQNITTVGTSALAYCAKLDNVNIPSTVTSLGSSVFTQCHNLKNILLPSGLTNLGPSSFYGCKKLKDITIPPVAAIQTGLFRDCLSLESVKFSEGTKSFTGSVFMGCTSLKSVDFAASTTTLNGSLFVDCSKLTTITIRSATPPLPFATLFAYAPVQQMTLRIPKGTLTPYAGSTVFKQVPRIVEGLIAPVLTTDSVSNVTQTTGKVYGNIASQGDGTLIKYGFVWSSSHNPDITLSTKTETSGSIPTGLISADLSNLTQGSVYYVRSYVTAAANSDTAGTVYGNEFSFQTVVDIQKAVTGTTTTVGNAIPGCLKLGLSNADKATTTDLTIAGKIDARDFKVIRDEMPALKNLNIGSAKITAYTGTDGTATGSISYSEKTIPTNAFLNKATLTDVILPDSVLGVSAGAFYHCTSLKSLSFNVPLTFLGDTAFAGCSGLRNLSIHNASPVNLSAVQKTFTGMNLDSCILHVPTDALSAYTSAVQWKDFKLIGEGFTAPTVSYSISSIYTSAIRLYAQITNFGDSKPTACGYIWGTTPNLTLASANKAGLTVPALNTGIYTDATGLTPGTTYYYRFYTINPSTTPGAGVNYAAVTSAKTTINSENVLSNVAVLQNVTPGSLSDNTYLSDAEKSTLSTLYISGKIDARDLKAIRDKMPNLSLLNLVNTSIEAYTGTEGPASSQSMEYTANTLPAKAFANTKLATLDLPSGLVAVGDSAFSNLINIPTLVLPGKVQSIGKSCFVNSKNIFRVLLPASLQSVGEKCFYGCSNLSFVVSMNSTPLILNPTDSIFYQVNKTNCKVYVPQDAKTSYKSASQWGDFNQVVEIPAPANSSAVVSINGTTATITGATAGCLSLPATMTAADKQAVTSLTISGSVDARDFRVMRDEMPALTSVDMTNSNIEAYYGLLGTYPLDSMNYALNATPANGFRGKLYLESYKMPLTTTSLGSTFQYCSKLKSVPFSPALSSISGSFFYCFALDSLTIPNTVTSIGPNTFSFCKNLKRITLSNNLTSGIGINAFKGCLSLDSIIIPEKVKTIPGNLFMGATSLKSVTLPSTTTNVSSAFTDCSSLRTIRCYAATAPATYNTLYNLAPVKQITLRIPKGSLSSYLLSPGFSLTPRIIEGFVDPAVASDSAVVLNNTSAKIYARVTSLGDSAATKYGFVWSTSPHPVVTLSTKTVTTGTITKGSISADLGSLNAGTTYYVRPYITVTANSDTAGTFYGEELSFTQKSEISKTINKTAIILEDLTPYALSKGLTAEEKASVTNLTLKGTIDARDLKIIRDELPALKTLNLTAATIAAYTGNLGTLNRTNTYGANELPDSALVGKNLLTSIALPDSLTALNANALENCTSLSDLTLSAKISSLGSYAFKNCTGLRSLTVKKSTPVDLTAATAVFNGVRMDSCILHVPTDALSDYTSAIQWKDFVNISEGLSNPDIVVNTTALPGSTYYRFYGNINSLGDLKSFDLGILWGTTSDLKYGDTCNVQLGARTATGSAFYDFTGLTPNKTYYFRYYIVKKGTTATSGLVYYPVHSVITKSTSPDFANNITSISGLTPGGLIGEQFLTASQKQAVTNLVITGTMDARDFKVIRDQMPNLYYLYITDVTIATYTGTQGTHSSDTTTYEANTLPGSAFRGRNFVTLSLPNNLIAIGDSAFRNSGGNFMKLILPSGIERLGDNCFENCLSLQQVMLPRNLKQLGNNCFLNCKVLTTVFAYNNPAADLSSVTQVFKDKYSLAELYVPTGSKSSYQADPNWSAFTTIKEFEPFVSTGATVETIGDSVVITNATPGCLMYETTLNKAQKEAAIRLSVSGTIDARDFKVIRDEMPALKIIDMKNVTIAAFKGREGTVNSVDSTNYPANFIPANALMSKTKMERFYFPTSATVIDYSAFSFCTSLNNVEIPSGYTLMNYNAFAYCTNLKSIHIPNTVTSFGTGILMGCSRLESMNLPTGFTLLNNNFFKDCISLKSLVIPDNVLTIGGYAFANCISLKEITFPKNLVAFAVSRGGYMFQDCDSLRTIRFLSATPPTNGSNTFLYSPYYKYTLRVPAGSLSYYVNNSVWNTVPRIIEGYVDPVVESKTIDNINLSSATFHGRVSSVGDVTSVGYGFVWSKNPNPTFSSGYKKLITGTPPIQATDFSATVSTLESGSTYYVRPFVRIMSSPVEAGIVYGEQMTFTAGIGVDVKDTMAVISNSYSGALQNPSVLSEEQKQVITYLKLTGSIDSRDIRVIHDQLPSLRYLDMSGCTIESYTGTEGVNYNNNQTYDANTLPENSFKGDSIHTILLPSSLENIGASAFEGSTLEKITIPSGLQHLRERAFADCKSLNTILVKIAQPLDLSATPDVFEGIDFNKCILRVPNDCLQAYKEAPVWNQFLLIGEGASLPVFRITHADESGTRLTITAGISDLGDFKMNEIGVLAIENETPTIFRNEFKATTTTPETTGTFQIQLDNLNPGTNYTLRLFAMTKATSDEAAVVYSDLFNYGTQKATLAISVSPTVLTSKIYDGSNLAAVANPGMLNGIRSEDLSKVQITAVASYSNEGAGLNKTIRISYILSGPGAERYKAPDDVIIENAVINKRLTIKALFEGYWNPETGKMNKCQEWDSNLQTLTDKFQGDVVDTLTLELHNARYSEITYALNGLQIHDDGRITSEGASAIAIPPILAGSYYVTVKNRNHLETTSASLLTFNNYAVDYNFSDSDNKAYESDLSFKPTKRLGSMWTIYAGDVTNDSNKQIDEYDLYSIFASRSAIQNTFGYSLYDLNGDGDTNDLDIYMMFENRSKFFYREE